MYQESKQSPLEVILALPESSMNITAFSPKKSLNPGHTIIESRSSSNDQEGSGNDEPHCSQQVPTDEQQDEELEQPPQKRKKNLSAGEKMYKAKLSYKREWEAKHPWIICKDPNEGISCGICKKWKTPPSESISAWSMRGLTDWNRVSELLKQHGRFPMA